MTKAFRNWLMILAVTLTLSIASCVPSVPRIYEVTGEKSDYRATLVEAYSTSQNCGHKGHYSCEVFMGKLVLDDGGGSLVRELDGFFYHKFVENGKRPLPAYVALTRADFGEEPATVWRVLQFVGFILFILVVIIVGYGCIGLPEDIQKEKETWR